MRFYQDKLYRVNHKGEVNGEGSVTSENIDDLSQASDMEDYEFISCE